MKDKYKKTLKLGDKVWVVHPNLSWSGVAKIVGFSKKKRCCHVECGGKTYKGIYSKDVTFRERN